MTLLINILLIASTYFSNNGTSSFNDKYFNPDYINVEIIYDSPAEIIPENYFSSSDQEQEKEIDNNFYCSNNVKRLTTNHTYTTFLYRLLPFLIDEPPPICCT